MYWLRVLVSLQCTDYVYLSVYNALTTCSCQCKMYCLRVLVSVQCTVYVYLSGNNELSTCTCQWTMYCLLVLVSVQCTVYVYLSVNNLLSTCTCQCTMYCLRVLVSEQCTVHAYLSSCPFIMYIQYTNISVYHVQSIVHVSIYKLLHSVHVYVQRYCLCTCQCVQLYFINISVNVQQICTFIEKCTFFLWFLVNYLHVQSLKLKRVGKKTKTTFSLVQSVAILPLYY